MQNADCPSEGQPRGAERRRPQVLPAVHRHQRRLSLHRGGRLHRQKQLRNSLAHILASSPTKADPTDCDTSACLSICLSVSLSPLPLCPPSLPLSRSTCIFLTSSCLPCFFSLTPSLTAAQFLAPHRSPPSCSWRHCSTNQVTPFQCRLRDCTYSAPLWVNVRYTRGRQIVNKANINIGRIPVMLLRYSTYTT